MILWRELFTHAGIQWVDRGANTSRGHINIRCAWCRDEDPSHHLAIEETTGAYYCRRNPDHYGRSAWRLLSALGLWKKAEKLLDDYSTAPVTRPAGQIREEEKPRRRLGLRPAHEVPPALEYLRTRGYADPEKTARTFGLAAAPYGRLVAPRPQRGRAPVRDLARHPRISGKEEATLILLRKGHVEAGLLCR